MAYCDRKHYNRLQLHKLPNNRATIHPTAHTKKFQNGLLIFPQLCKAHNTVWMELRDDHNHSSILLSTSIYTHSYKRIDSQNINLNRSKRKIKLD